MNRILKNKSKCIPVSSSYCQASVCWDTGFSSLGISISVRLMDRGGVLRTQERCLSGVKPEKPTGGDTQGRLVGRGFGCWEPGWRWAVETVENATAG